jgi:hypothetical protein
MKKLTVIGRGTAGCISAAHFLHYTDWHVDFYHDHNIKPQAVGEGSNLVLPQRLNHIINFQHEDLQSVDGTFKYGIKKTGWGNGKEFIHNFPPPNVGYHFNALKLQDLIINKLKNNPRCRIIEDNISDHSEIDSDYIMDCSGSPENYDDFILPESIPVNSVYVTQCFWEYPKFQYTLTLARPYGWVFGIPLQNRCSIGYLYNNKITDLEEIKNDVVNVFNEYNLTPSNTTNSFSFKNYYRKNNFNSRIAYNGNASFFLEPLEATSIAFMDVINRLAYDTWIDGADSNDSNRHYRRHITEIENIIMLHYYAGSTYKTNFWDYAKSNGEKNIKNAIKNQSFLEMVNYSKFNDPNIVAKDDYGTWWLGSFYQNLLNLDLYNKIDNIINQN